MTRLLNSTTAVLFDLDGTLLDTARDLVRVLHVVCDEEGQNKPDGELAGRYVSHGAIGLIRLAFPEADADTQEHLRKRLVKLYEDSLVVETQAYPGVLQMLDDLDARDIAWGIVTNKMRYLAAPIIEHFGLHERCRTLVGGDTAARNKPHPDPIVLALAELATEPSAAIYVGDAEKDMLAGRAAGTRTVGVTWGYVPPGDRAPHEWDADYTIDHPRELLTL
ncbi:MAG: HAD-IA family hydrolase [Gammaproteobacteria bacterium]|nr:HAD-IA family hydrolase [Gammaproteobacteria bacterium]